MMWGYDGFGFGFGAGGMGIGMVLFWGLIVFGIVMVARGFGGSSSAGEPRARDKTPRDILGERYARGDIDRSEFEQKRSDLKAVDTMPMEKPRREFLKADSVEAS